MHSLCCGRWCPALHAECIPSPDRPDCMAKAAGSCFFFFFFFLTSSSDGTSHTAGCCLVALELTGPRLCGCRHRAHKAGAPRGSEGVALASRGGHAKASSSSGRAYTSSGGLPPQLPHTCHSCGDEMGGASRYSRSHWYMLMQLPEHCP